MLADAESFGVSDWSRHDGGVARSDMGLLVGRHRFFGRIGTGNDRHGSFRSGCPYAFCPSSGRVGAFDAPPDCIDEAALSGGIDSGHHGFGYVRRTRA